MMAIDFLMADNLGVAKDSIALTPVMLEQACYGQWAIRVRSDTDDARRCSSFSRHEPPAGSELPCKSICTLSGSALGDGLDCISEGAGHKHHKAQRAFVRSRPGFYSWLRARGCSKAKDKRIAKEKGSRKKGIFRRLQRRRIKLESFFWWQSG